MKKVDTYCSLKKDEEGKIYGIFTAYRGLIGQDAIILNFRLRGTKTNLLCLKGLEYKKSDITSISSPPTVKETIVSLIHHIIDFSVVNHLKLNVPTSFLSNLKHFDNLYSEEIQTSVNKLFKDNLIDKYMKPSGYREREFVGIDSKLKEASVYEWYRENVRLSKEYNSFPKEKDILNICKELKRAPRYHMSDILQAIVDDKVYITSNLREVVSFSNQLSNNQTELRKQMTDVLYNLKNSDLTREQKKIADVIKYILKDKYLREKVVFTNDISYATFVLSIHNTGGHCMAKTKSNTHYLIDLSKGSILKAARAAKEIAILIKDPTEEVDRYDEDYYDEDYWGTFYVD